jgi:Ca2+-binding EF-hand superfamily protein
MPSFAEFDLNGDGILNEQEFYEARANRIAERSQQGYMMRNLENAPPFNALDLDGDGRLRPDEFASGQAQHMQQRMQTR